MWFLVMVVVGLEFGLGVTIRIGVGIGVVWCGRQLLGCKNCSYNLQ